jgi:hypothetical protein
MPRTGFEPAIPMFERPKTVLALDRAAIETSAQTIIVVVVVIIIIIIINLFIYSSFAPHGA